MDIKRTKLKLLTLFKKDQNFRNIKIDTKKFKNQTGIGYTFIKETFEKYGYIDTERFGKKAAIAAWTLVQHSGKENVDFMEKYLKAMKNHSKSELLDLQALLEDRVLIYKNKPQIYGSQLTPVKEGIQCFEPIKDLKNVDKKRERLGMEPLFKYAEKFNTKVILPTGYHH